MRFKRGILGLGGICLASLMVPASVPAANPLQIAPASIGAEPVPGTQSADLQEVAHIAPPADPGANNELPAGQYGALAVAGNCVYLGRRSYDAAGQASASVGVQAVKITDPTFNNDDNGVNTDTATGLSYVGQVPDSAISGSTAREVRAIAADNLLIVLQYTQFTGAGGDGFAAPVPGYSGLYDNFLGPGRNYIQAFRIDPASCNATLIGAYDMGAVRPHEFYTWIDPVAQHGVVQPLTNNLLADRVLAYVTTPPGGVDLEVQDFTDCALVARQDLSRMCNPTLLTIWSGAFPQTSPNSPEAAQPFGSYLHSLAISPDGKTGYMAFWNGGLFTVDTSQVASGQANPVIVGEASAAARFTYQNAGPLGQGGDVHSAVPVPSSLYGISQSITDVVTSDEEYLGLGDCPFGWDHVVSLSSDPSSTGHSVAVPTEVGSYGLPENNLAQIFPTALDYQSRAQALGQDPSSCASYLAAHNNLPDHSSQPTLSATGQQYPVAYIAPDNGGAWASKGYAGVLSNTYSSHDPTVLPHAILTTWYGGGFQLIDITKPSNPTQAGFFIPTPVTQTAEEVDDGTGIYLSCYFTNTPDANNQNNCAYRTQSTETAGISELGHQITPGSLPTFTSWPKVESWSYPIIADGHIFFADNRNGLYVLKYRAGASSDPNASLLDSEINAPGLFREGNSNQGY